MPRAFDVETVVVCDFIRHEGNGKDILIGVYGSGIRVAALPTNIALSFWIELKPHQTGDIPFKLRVIGSGNTVILSMPVAPIHVPDERNVNMEVPPLLMTFQSAGKVEVQVAGDDDDWLTIKTLGIEVGTS